MNAKIINVSEGHTGIGNYSRQLAKNLDCELMNHYLSPEHYYLDFFKHSILKKRLDETVIFSSIFSIRYKGKKNITIIHDFFPVIYDGILKRDVFKIAYQQAKSLTDEFVAVSHYTEEKIDAKNKTVIYPFVENFGQREEPVIDYLFDATDTKNKQPHLYEEFADYIYSKKNLGKIIAFRLGAVMKNTNVYSTGQIPFETVQRYYRKSKLFISFSENEGFGYPLAQSMLIGLPVIVWRNPTYYELLGNFPYYISSKMDMQEIYEMSLQAMDDSETSKSMQTMMNEKLDPNSLREQWQNLMEEI